MSLAQHNTIQQQKNEINNKKNKKKVEETAGESKIICR